MGKPKKKKRKLSAYNKHMSAEMKKGRTFKQAVASWKSGGKKSSPKKKASKKTGGKTTMGRRGGFSTQKLFKVLRIGALLMPAAAIAMKPVSAQEKIEQGMQIYTGSRPGVAFRWDKLAEGWGAYISATVMTTVVPKFISFIRGIF